LPVAEFLLAGLFVSWLAGRLRAAWQRSEQGQELVTRRILDSLPAHIALLDGAGNIVQVNSAWERFARANGDPAFARSGVGSNYLAVCEKAAHEGDELALQVQDGLRRLLDGSLRKFSIEYPCHSPTEQRWFLLHATPLCGQPGVVCSHVPLTDLKRAEEELQQSEDRFRLMADHAPVMIWMSGTDKLCTWFNKQWLDFVGRPLGREVGNGWSENVHPGDFDRCLQTYAAAFDARQPFTMEYRLKQHDGEYRWLLDNGIPLYGAGGKFTGYIGSCIDITDRKEAEEALRQSEAESRRLLDYHQAVMANMGEGLYTTDTQCLVTYMNPAAESLFGWKSAELLGRRMHDVTHYQYPDGRPFPIEECSAFQVLHEGKALKDHDDVFIRRDGSFFPVVYSSSPLVADGKVAGLVVVFRDVTDRKRDEEKLRGMTADLRAKVEELTTLLDILPGGVMIADPHCRRLTGNRALNEMLGVPQGANVSLTAEQPDLPAGIRVLRDGRELSADECPMQVTGLTGRRFKDFDYDLVFPDGRVVTLRANTAPLLDEHGTVRGVIGAYMDISDRKRTEERLRASEARMQAILNTAADAVITIDYRGIIQSVNPATERLFGYAAGEMVGQNITMLMPSLYGEEYARHLERYLRTGVRSIIGSGREIQAQRKDGTTFAADLAVSDMAPLRLFTGILRDISPRKQLEREVLEIAAGEQRRIGQELHDGVGQELTGLSLMADTLVERLETTSPPEVELAAKILGGLGRIHEQVRALSRGLVPVEVDPEGLRAALQELAARTEDQAGVRCALVCAGPVEVADSVTATHLFRIAQEAISNALRHGLPRNIRIALRGEPGTLILSIQDDGAGLAGSAEEGSGLGIRLMRYRAGAVGGTLRIGPAAGGGTAVRCTVPRAAGGDQ
jgi:PAS domain S-box-containing protein